MGMAEFKVAEIFTSINGEGMRAGELAVFIRLQGCNLRCGYCDTMWANEAGAPCKWMTTEEILQKVKSEEIRNITLTGGPAGYRRTDRKHYFRPMVAAGN